MKRFFALLLAGLLLLSLAACGKGQEDNGVTTGATTAEPTGTATATAPGPFAAARRIFTYADLEYDRENMPIIKPEELLVYFHFMDTFDAETWKASTAIQVTWAIETFSHIIVQNDMGIALQKSELEDSGLHLFSKLEDYGFGSATTETWMLPKAEFTAAYNAMMTAAEASESKDFWLVPNNYSGVLNYAYDTETSFRVASYLPEQLRPNAKPIHMSTELMHKYFPFLGKSVPADQQPTTARPPQSTALSTASTGTGRPSGTVLPMLVHDEIEQDGLLLRVRQNNIGHFAGTPFTLTASITNTTGRDITYGVGSGTPNVHMEIQVRLPGFTDLDLVDKMWTEDYRFATLKAGETFTETIRFSPNDLPAGDYEGTAVFTYYPGTIDDPGEAKRLELKFTVPLV